VPKTQFDASVDDDDSIDVEADADLDAAAGALSRWRATDQFLGCGERGLTVQRDQMIRTLSDNPAL